MIELSPYKVRDGFYLHLKEGGIHPPGTVIKLSPEQFQSHSHQLDPVEEESPKPTRSRAKAKPEAEST